MISEYLKYLQGVSKQMRLGFCFIAVIIIIQHSVDHIPLKTDILSLVFDTKNISVRFLEAENLSTKFDYQNS